MARIIRTAVIGIGSMGKQHARVYAQLSGVELVGVADIDDDAVSETASLHHSRAYSSYRQMLEIERPDAVSVTVPTKFHREVTEHVLKKGIHALVEKPLCHTVKEGKQMIAVAKKSKVILGVGHIERFNPVVIELKKHLEKKKLGRIFQIAIRRIGPFPRRITDVGVFLDLATHDIDVMSFLVGTRIDRISAESGNVLNQSHEDVSVSLFRFQSGIIGVLVENWISPTKIRDMIINGENGMFVADMLTQDLYFYENNYTTSSWDSLAMFRGMTEGNMTRFYIARNEPLRLELAAFIEAVRGKKPFPVGGADGLRAVSIAQKLLSLSKR